MTLCSPTPAPQPAPTITRRRSFTIGLPASDSLFAVTPEGAARLVDRGYRVKIEAGAADGIHYTDNQYILAGAAVVDRHEALGCDIVILPGRIGRPDVPHMRRGAMLLTLWHPSVADSSVLRQLLERSIITVALDLVRDDRGHTPFADILAEIDGRAAVALASSLLADAVTGKGILLGGIAGTNPCEVTILGSGIAARAAARSAAGLGATVRMFDDDIYSLRDALRELGTSVIGTALQPRGFANALHWADIVIVTPMKHPVKLDSDQIADMKRGLIAFDLTPDTKSFPSMQPMDLSQGVAKGPIAMGRVCYTNARTAVPRTTAMALSDTIITMLSELHTREGGVADALKLSPGLQKGVLTFLGHPVHKSVADAVKMRQVDITLFLHLT